MSYVFHSVWNSSQAPKAASNIQELMKRTSGSEMKEEHLEVFLQKLQGEIEKANASGHHAKIEMYHKQEVHYSDYKVHGQINVFNGYKWGQKDIARIDYIQVGYGWALDTKNVLYMYPYSEKIKQLP